MSGIVPAVGALLVLLAVSPPARAGCHLRLADGVPDVAALDVELEPQPGGAVRTETLSYLGATGHTALEPGRWDARVLQGGTQLGSIRFGCDEGGYYTLVAFGLDPRPADRRPSWLDRLRRIFGGVEARVDAGYVLQLKVLRDHAGEDRSAGYLRVVHAAPGIGPLEVGLRRDGETEAVARNLRYAAVGELERLLPGDGRLEVRFEGARRVVAGRELSLPPGTVSTLLVTGPARDREGTLDLLVLTNPVRSELLASGLRSSSRASATPWQRSVTSEPVR